MRVRLHLLLILLMLPVFAQASSSKGKITGFITDSSGESLPGVQIILEGSTRGTISELDGFYQILNLDPGFYTLVFKYIGFSDIRISDIEVLPDKTTEISVVMRESVIEGQEITVVAERPLIQRDRTTTTATVNERQISNLPVVSLAQIVNLQAGVVDGHFRGGRRNEVSYMVNGVPINNPYNNTAGFEVEQNMVSSLEVISGVFNAEYGQAMSGVVNITTRGIPDKWTVNTLGYVRSFATTKSMEFLERTSGPGNDLSYSDFRSRNVSYMEAADPINLLDGQVTIGGPLLKDKLGFRITGRYVRDKGHFIGRDLFLPGDQSRYINNPPPGGYTDPSNPQQDWIIASNGSGDFLSMSDGERMSANTALVYDASSRLKLDYNLFYQGGSYTGYNHARKYAPGGRNSDLFTNMTHILGARYTVNNVTFVNLSYSYQHNKYDSRLYDSPYDTRYVSPETANRVGAFAFAVSGNDLYMVDNLTTSQTIVGNITSQVNRSNQVKAGFQFRRHTLDNLVFDIDVNQATGLAAPASENWRRTKLNATPFEFSAYIQDKIEIQDLIINAGIRMDYFEPDFEVPVDWDQANRLYITDPSNPADSLYNRKEAKSKFQMSPRIGIAFPISSTGVIRFSYGLFFQIPELSQIYSNPNYVVNEYSSSTRYGNADINPQTTSTFEIGLQQGLTDDLGMEITMFTRDVRNLIGDRINFDVGTTNYVVRYINRDYGTVRGFTFSLFQRPRGPLSWNVDYTLQFADGSSAISGDAFQRVEAGLEETLSLTRLDWDRRHSLNATVTYSPIPGFNMTMVNRLNSGNPYTTVRNFVASYIRNNKDRPYFYMADLRMYYKPSFIKQNMSLLVQVENLFDVIPEYGIYADSGNAYETIEKERNRGSILQGLNTLDDFFYRQDFLGSPRRISIGLNLNF
jgi:outer membrane receptor for ferrienterochelin and colicin